MEENKDNKIDVEDHDVLIITLHKSPFRMTMAPLTIKSRNSSKIQPNQKRD